MVIEDMGNMLTSGAQGIFLGMLEACPFSGRWLWECVRFIGRTDAKAEAPILWPPDAKS